MKRPIAFLLIKVVVGILIFGCSENEKRSFELFGKFEGSNTEQLLFIFENTQGKSCIDTIKVINGEFYSKGEINGAVYARIEGNKKSQRVTDPNMVRFFIEPGKNYISLKENQFKKATITGSNTQKEHEYLESLLEGLHIEIDTIKLSWNKLSKKKTIGSKNHNALNESIELLEVQWENRNKEIMNVRLRYLQKHPNSYLNPYWLIFYSKKLRLDTLEFYYDNFSPKVKNSLYGRQFEEKIRLTKEAANNARAPDFQLVDVLGKKISLENFRGKYVLLDFWASWCAPCRELHPDLINLHKKYYKEDFEIIGVSIDENRNAWKSAIEKEGTDTWYHINSWDNQVPIHKLYNIKPIPALIFIDKNGVIKGRYLAADNYKQNFEDLMQDLDFFLL